MGFQEAYVQLEVDSKFPYFFSFFYLFTIYMYMYLSFTAPPYATSVPDHVTARRGDSLRLQCIAHGSHPIRFQWVRVGRVGLPSGAKSTKDGVLSVPHLKVADSGTYKCIATNHVGAGETSATVTVRGESLYYTTLCSTLFLFLLFFL